MTIGRHLVHHTLYEEYVAALAATGARGRRGRPGAARGHGPRPRRATASTYDARRPPPGRSSAERVL
ncbi:hypothetical protein [Actinomadura vinacea]|uniref:hypothetical protein n=1 Tax=Actinomadura vinacea TaxID=115336 RepID=UPI003CD0ACDE